MSQLPTHQPKTTPEVVDFTFDNVRSFPSRFLNPPDVSHVPRIRSYRVKPHFQVTLDDILSNKHLPPLSATDFENYLTYVEHDKGSVQNLQVLLPSKARGFLVPDFTSLVRRIYRYFLLWLTNYTQQYNAWKSSLSSIHSPSSSAPSRSTATGASSTTHHNTHTLTAQPQKPSSGHSHSGSTSKSGKYTSAAEADPARRTTASVQPSKPLAYSWYRARRTFFLPVIAEGGPLSTATNPVHTSHLQLKVHPELLHPFIADAYSASPVNNLLHDAFPKDLIEDAEDEKLYGKKKNTYYDPHEGEGRKKKKGAGGGLVHPSPERFELIRIEVEKRLDESLKRFIDVSFTNTGNYRGLFGTSVSILNFVAAVVLLVAIACWGKSYALFVVTYFFLWNGSWGCIVTLNGICCCVFLFGSRQWFPYEVDDCEIPKPVSPPESHGETINDKPARVDDEEGPDEDNYDTKLRDLEIKKEAREKREEMERQRGLAEAEARVVAGGGESRAQMLASLQSSIATAKSASEDEASVTVDDEPLQANRVKRPLTQATNSSASGVGTGPGTNGGEVFISEAYSEGFSPSSSLVQISLSGSSAGEQTDPLDTLGGISSIALVPSPAGVTADGDMTIAPQTPSPGPPAMHPPNPLPTGARSDASEYTGNDTVWPPNLESISVAGANRRGSDVLTAYPPVPSLFPAPPQLIPHDHAHLRMTRPAHHRPLVTTSSGGHTSGSGSATTPTLHIHLQSHSHSHTTSHAQSSRHRHKRPASENPSSPTSNPQSPHSPDPTSPQATSTPTSRWPRFDFDKLPDAPPPPELTGSRRAIAFTAPMTSIQQCPLVVRMQWDLVIRSMLWGLVVGTILEAICIAIVVPIRLKRGS